VCVCVREREREREREKIYQATTVEHVIAPSNYVNATTGK